MVSRVIRRMMERLLRFNKADPMQRRVKSAIEM